jgi:hypothetical protein
VHVFELLTHADGDLMRTLVDPSVALRLPSIKPRSISMKLKLLGTAAAAALLFPLAVWSAPTLTIVPSAPSVVVGGSVSVDVVVSGLSADDQIVSAFDLDVIYDATFLSATGTTFKAAAAFGGTDPVTGDNWVFDTLGSSAGDAAGTGYSLAEDSFLQGLQGDSVTLFTVTFAALKAGIVTLDFGLDPDFERSVGGLGGADLPSLTYATGRVEITSLPPCVGAACNVPEPESYGLVAVALLAAGLAGRGRRSAKKGTPQAA